MAGRRAVSQNASVSRILLRDVPQELVHRLRESARGTISGTLMDSLHLGDGIERSAT